MTNSCDKQPQSYVISSVCIFYILAFLKCCESRSGDMVNYTPMTIMTITLIRLKSLTISQLWQCTYRRTGCFSTLFRRSSDKNSDGWSRSLADRGPSIRW